MPSPAPHPAGRADVGAFQQGSQPVRLTVKIGDAPEHVVRVRMYCNGRTLRH